jgi:hypothetical protein
MLVSNFLVFDHLSGYHLRIRCTFEVLGSRRLWTQFIVSVSLLLLTQTHLVFLLPVSVTVVCEFSVSHTCMGREGTMNSDIFFFILLIILVGYIAYMIYRGFRKEMSDHSNTSDGSDLSDYSSGHHETGHHHGGDLGGGHYGGFFDGGDGGHH